MLWGDRVTTMKKQSQKDIVIKHLLDTGKVSRNTCIKNHFITRLGAIICDLNQEGWIIEGRDEHTNYGTDYIYIVRKSPFKKKEYFVEGKLVSSAWKKI